MCNFQTSDFAGCYCFLAKPLECWYKFIHTGHPSRCTRILHRQGKWLALTKWSSSQSIKIRSHCFFQPKVQTSHNLGWIYTIYTIGICRWFFYQTSIMNKKHVSEVGKASYFHIRALRHIRSSLTIDAAKTVASAIVGSRLDYCNSLLACTSVLNLSYLQLVQNTLARVVAQKPLLLSHHTGSDWPALAPGSPANWV